MAMAENLNRAIQNGDEELVRSLVQDGAAMDHLLGMRGTALCAALSARQSSIATYLIDAGCGVNVEDYDREPPLYLAISKCCFGVVKKLVNHPECNINKADPLTKTPPLCLAVSSNYMDVVTWFTEAGADLNVRDVTGGTALHISIKAKHYSVTELLIKANCNLYLTDQNGMASVHLSASMGDVKSLKILLCKWIEIDDNVTGKFLESKVTFTNKKVEDNVFTLINFKSKVRNDTPVKIAISKCHNVFTKILLKYGAQPNITEDGNTPSPLILACVNHLEKKLDFSVIEWLLESGANVNYAGAINSSLYSDSGRCDTPIMFASRLNALPLVKILVKHGAHLTLQDINFGKSSGMTPLYYALENNSLDVAWYFIKECPNTVIDSEYYNLLCALGNVNAADVFEIVEILVTKGLSVNGSNISSAKPMEVAIDHENALLVMALIDNGADVNSLPCDSSPLHRCAEFGNIEIARVLLSSGADVNQENAAGVTALRTAMDYADDEHIELCYFLLDAGCDVPKDMTFSSIEFADVNANQHALSRGSDESSDDDSDSESIDGDIPPALEEDRNLRTLLSQISSSPRDLFKLCLQRIRKHFIENRIQFSNISQLQIPKKFINKLLYKS